MRPAPTRTPSPAAWKGPTGEGGIAPEGCTVTCLAVKFGFWLEAQDAFLDSHHPLRIAELVPLTPGEAELHERDLDAFIRRYDDEQVYLVDFRRK